MKPKQEPKKETDRGIASTRDRLDAYYRVETGVPYLEGWRAAAMVREVVLVDDDTDLIELAYLLDLDPNISGSAVIGNQRWCTRSLSPSSADIDLTI